MQPQTGQAQGANRRRRGGGRCDRAHDARAQGEGQGQGPRDEARQGRARALARTGRLRAGALDGIETSLTAQAVEPPPGSDDANAAAPVEPDTPVASTSRAKAKGKAKARSGKKAKPARSPSPADEDEEVRPAVTANLTAQFAGDPPSEPDSPVKPRGKGKAKAAKPRAPKKAKAAPPPSPVPSDGAAEARCVCADNAEPSERASCRCDRRRSARARELVEGQRPGWLGQARRRGHAERSASAWRLPPPI